MPRYPRISEAEWEVMEVLWRRSRLTSLEVVQQLNHRKEWKDQTIRTMLSRLIQKGVVGYTAEGRVYRYRPLVSREKCVQQVSQSFLERVFEGTASSLVLHFVKNNRLSDKDMAELKAILNQNEKGKRR
jgi:BlaI family penicillinase repressor